jgi:hypothetical protein
MSLQFNTIGFINFNKEYNKVLKSGAITVSFTASTKDKDGNYQTQYFNGLVPAKLVDRIKPLLNKEVCDIKGVINPAEKGYVNFTILEVGKHVKKENNAKQSEDIDLPF